MSLEEQNQPEEPTEDDCCNSGCKMCVFDIYNQQLELWKKNKKSINSVRQEFLSQTCFKPFRLQKIILVNHNTNIYHFQAVGKSTQAIFGILPYRAGQHLILRLNHEKVVKSSTITTRAYTVISNNEEENNCTFQVLIKLYDDGLMSNYLKTLSTGDVTFWRGPYGNYLYEPNKFRSILMICMGTGIAPMYAITKDVVNNEIDETVILLMYGSRNISEILLRDELYKLSSYWNFNYICYLSQNFDKNNKKYSENFINGKISKEHINSNITNPTESQQVLICGSKEFSDDVFTIVLNSKVPETNIFIF